MFKYLTNLFQKIKGDESKSVTDGKRQKQKLVNKMKPKMISIELIYPVLH